MSPPSRSLVDRAKRALREQQRAVRQSAYSHEAGLLLAQRYKSLLPPRVLSGLCAGYFPIGSEIDARATMRVHSRQPCLLPVVQGKGMKLLFRFWREGEALEEGSFGTRHPPARAGSAVPEVLLVPLLGFDSNCMRLGYGGGFYDRTLSALRMQNRNLFALGLAFEAQLVPEIPTTDSDAPLDAVLSECNLYYRRQLV